MINENGTMVAQEKFNVVHLNEIVKNKPEILLIYPVLNYLYNSDGSSKNFEELMTSYTNENLNTIYHDYLINYIADNKLKTLKIQKYSTNEQKNIFNNLIYLWKNEKIKIEFNFFDVVSVWHTNLFVHVKFWHNG